MNISIYEISLLFLYLFLVRIFEPSATKINHLFALVLAWAIARSVTHPLLPSWIDLRQIVPCSVWFHCHLFVARLGIWRAKLSLRSCPMLVWFPQCGQWTWNGLWPRKTPLPDPLRQCHKVFMSVCLWLLWVSVTVCIWKPGYWCPADGAFYVLSKVWAFVIIYKVLRRQFVWPDEFGASLNETLA